MKYESEILNPLPINQHPKGLVNNHNGGDISGDSCVRDTDAPDSLLRPHSSTAVTPKERLMLPSPEPTHPHSPDTQSHTTREALNCSCRTMAFSEAPRKQRDHSHKLLAAPCHSEKQEATLGGAAGPPSARAPPDLRSPPLPPRALPRSPLLPRAAFHALPLLNSALTTS